MSGDLTMDDVIDIAKQVVDKTDAQYGILHRPNKGPDYIMVFQPTATASSIPAAATFSSSATSLRRHSAGSSAVLRRGSFRPTTPRWNSMHSAKSSTREMRRSGCTASGTWAPTRFQLTGCRPTRLASPTGMDRLTGREKVVEQPDPSDHLRRAADAADPELAVRLLGRRPR